MESDQFDSIFLKIKMMKELAIGSVMIDIEGQSLTTIDKEKIAHPNTGGLILFSRNFDNPDQILELIKSIRQARSGDILIAVDQEGGRVQRFQNGFTRLPPAGQYQKQAEIVQDAGWLMAAELLSVGVDFSFAPVLDIDYGVSEIIGDRSFANRPTLVAELGAAFCKGMQVAGMATTGKHFPGHGAVVLDSHLSLPIDDRDLETLRTQDIIPFQHLIATGLSAVMPAHIVYPQIDKLPAGFSEVWLQTILREELKFDGVIFSDDLSMAGAASVGDFFERAGLALQAGCDMILVCNNPQAAEQVLNNLAINNNKQRQQRLLSMRGKFNIKREQLLKSDKWQSIVLQLQKLSSLYA